MVLSKLKTACRLILTGDFETFLNDLGGNVNEIGNYVKLKLRGLFKNNAKKIILVIDFQIPTYDKDSGSLRLFYLLRILKELGNEVIFIPNNLKKVEPYSSELQQMGIKVFYGYIPLETLFEKMGKYIDIAILARPMIAINYISWIKKYASKAKVIYDTVDLHFLRLQRQAKIENNEKVLKEAEEYKKLELFLAQESDLTIVVSPVEKEILLKEIPYLKVEVIPNVHEIYKINKPFKDRKDLLFLGGFKHSPNEDAVLFFSDKIFPKIRKSIPDIKLYVVGSYPTEKVLALNSKNIIVTGYVKDITPYFENCRVFVAPLRYGAGVKGKIGLSMSYGLPTVTTSIGAEGMGLIDGKNALIADDPVSFAEKVMTLYENEELWNILSANAQKHIQGNFSPKIIKEKLSQILSKVLSD